MGYSRGKYTREQLNIFIIIKHLISFKISMAKTILYFKILRANKTRKNLSLYYIVARQ